MGIGVLSQGFAQQTAAVRAGVAKASGRRGGQTTQRRRKKKAAGAVAKTKRRKTGKKSRLVKGSAAAKAYMAKIRRKRK